jgi:hypothetical protein
MTQSGSAGWCCFVCVAALGGVGLAVVFAAGLHACLAEARRILRAFLEEP